jgi:hypothetical protein
MHLDLNQSAENFIATVKTPSTRIHFAQLGEDALLWHYFHKRRSGFYIDVGCHDPYRYSNTYILYRHLGWSGINIDADARAIALFKRARPTDINLSMAIGSTAREQEFTVFQDGAVNTFDPELAARQRRSFEVAGSYMTRLCPLRDVLSAHISGDRNIDYMNIDCEGLDHEILLSNDWTKFRPEIISIEIHNLDLQNPTSDKTVSFLISQGYRMSAHYLVTTFFERMRNK